MAIPSRNLGQRLLLSLGTVVLLLGLGECALRRIYSTLPSLAPLKDDTLQVERYVPPGWEQARPPAPDPDGCHESHPNRDLARPPAWQKEVEGDGEPLRIWALGDSITFGMGVEPEETFAMHLAEKAAAMTGRPVVLSNFGISGANYCTLLRESHRELAFRTPPELLLWNLFADDLQLRSVILTQGALLGFPERIASSWLRPLATHSYLVNLVWVTTRARAGSPPPRFVNMAGQAQFQKAAREFRDHLAQMEITLVTSLISPSGMPLCVAG